MTSDIMNGQTTARQLYVETPLLKSRKLSDRQGCNVWLKLENVQNSGSFKARGLGYLCNKAASNGCTKLISSSGGNAGLAAAFCARELGLPITVIVPRSTPDFMVQKLKEEGAGVEVVGKVWDEANQRAMELAAAPGCQLIHPFDHPDIWEGHASMVEEIKHQLRGIVPDLVVLSVGGGGLMNGVLEGLHRVGWGETPVLALETDGADSLAACVRSGKWVELDDITSVAKCLGAKRVSQKSFEWLSQHPVVSHVVTDKEAISACINIADDHRILVAPACGAALAGVYGSPIPDLQKAGKLPQTLSNIVVIVCGGSGVNLDTIQKWKKTYNL